MTTKFKVRALRSLLNGISILDLPRLEVNSMKEAEEFIRSYGIDIKEPSQWHYVQSIYHKAFYFLFDYLLEKKHILSDIPMQLTEFAELARLLMQASRQSEMAEAKLRTLWSCALLRVAHVLFHAEHDWRNRYLPLAKPVIIDPIKEAIQLDYSGNKWIGKPKGEGSVQLVDFKFRLDKQFESRLIKLIHKPQVVAQDIYDRIALRFVTKRKLDTLRVLQYLLDHHLINISHLLPARSRNTLFDVDSAFMLLDEWDGESENQLDELEERLTNAVEINPENLVSSDQYRACHLTLRKMVSVKDADLGNYRFFLPFEIQLMDQTSFEDSIMGYSAHDQYKVSQKDMVLERLLGSDLLHSLKS